jgi:hypothetical protein
MEHCRQFRWQLQMKSHCVRATSATRKVERHGKSPSIGDEARKRPSEAFSVRSTDSDCTGTCARETESLGSSAKLGRMRDAGRAFNQIICPDSPSHDVNWAFVSSKRGLDSLLYEFPDGNQRCMNSRMEINVVWKRNVSQQLKYWNIVRGKRNIQDEWCSRSNT